MLAGGIEDCRQRIPQSQFDGIRAQYVRPPEISLPLLKDRTEVAEYDVVLGYSPVRWVLPIGLEGVYARSDDPLMPESPYPEKLPASLRMASLASVSHTPAASRPPASTAAQPQS
jgi:hypothetical protein